MPEVPCIHPPLARAVQLCCDARNRILLGDGVLTTPRQADNPNFDAEGFAEAVAQFTRKLSTFDLCRIAYHSVMPDPSTRQGARDFIACVLHGIAIGAIRADEGRVLLNGSRSAILSYKHAKQNEGKERANAQLNLEICEQAAE